MAEWRGEHCAAVQEKNMLWRRRIRPENFQKYDIEIEYRLDLRRLRSKKVRGFCFSSRFLF